MDFVAVMLFTQQIFYSKWLFFFWRLLILELVVILDQISAYWHCLWKCCLWEKACTITFFFSLLKTNIFSTWIYFCSYLVFHWGNIVKKSAVKNKGFRKTIKWGDDHRGRVVYERGVQTFTLWYFSQNISRFHSVLKGPKNPLNFRSPLNLNPLRKNIFRSPLNLDTPWSQFFPCSLPFTPSPLTSFS